MTSFYFNITNFEHIHHIYLEQAFDLEKEFHLLGTIDVKAMFKMQAQLVNSKLQLRAIKFAKP